MITGEIVTLRPLTEADEDALYELVADLGTWEENTPAAPTAITRTAFAERFQKWLSPEPGSTLFAIELAGVVIGRCDLFGVDELARSGEVGIGLVASARGRGAGTDALRLLVRFGFVRRNLHRVHLRCIASNAAAIACYRKTGFVQEGVLRESAWVRGSYEDEIVMGVLRAEWAG
ncbi:MAG TPA: GNAT family protein [Jatrophihabitans sp.]